MPAYSNVAAILDAWWRDEIMNSPISRNTEIHNALAASFEKLKAQFAPPPDTSSNDHV